MASRNRARLPVQLIERSDDRVFDRVGERTTMTEAAYTPVARILHWTTAILVLANIPIGIVMLKLQGGPTQDFLFRLHESIGALLIPIIIYRLIYRLTHPPLPLPAEIPAIHRHAAEGLHWALY